VGHLCWHVPCRFDPVGAYQKSGAHSRGIGAVHRGGRRKCWRARHSSRETEVLSSRCVSSAGAHCCTWDSRRRLWGNLSFEPRGYCEWQAAGSEIGGESRAAKPSEIVVPWAPPPTWASCRERGGAPYGAPVIGDSKRQLLTLAERLQAPAELVAAMSFRR
jgi:hypothetical protein